MLFLFGALLLVEIVMNLIIHIFANVSTFYIADLMLGNLFCARYKYKPLKYGLSKYPAYITFTVTCKCAPFSL